MSAVKLSIPVARPLLGDVEASAARRAILSGWVTQGPEVAAFEREFADTVGADYACAVSNCTAALHLALLAAGVVPGDEVITVSHSFIATANSVRYCGAVPVFIDVQSGGLNMDPAQIESAVSPRTRAILCVHQVGIPCDLPRIIEIAHSHSLPVIEDAACAIGSEIKWSGRWERIGRPHGDAACFSFHPRKLITTGDGGMITTSRRDWDEKFRLWRQHSMTIPDTVRHNLKKIRVESYSSLGYNYRLTDIQAAVGREQLKRLHDILTRRTALAEHYSELLSKIPGVSAPILPIWARTNWQSYCVRLPEWCDQHRVMQSMLDAGVSVRPGIMCAHREPAYDHGDETAPIPCRIAPIQGLPNSEDAQDRTIILPLFHEMTEDEQRYVVETLAAAVSCRRPLAIGRR